MHRIFFLFLQYYKEYFEQNNENVYRSFSKKKKKLGGGAFWLVTLFLFFTLKCLQTQISIH